MAVDAPVFKLIIYINNLIRTRTRVTGINNICRFKNVRDIRNAETAEKEMEKISANAVLTGADDRLTGEQREKLCALIKTGVYKELHKLKMLTEEQLSALIKNQSIAFSCVRKPQAAKDKPELHI